MIHIPADIADLMRDHGVTAPWIPTKPVYVPTYAPNYAPVEEIDRDGEDN